MPFSGPPSKKIETCFLKRPECATTYEAACLVTRQLAANDDCVTGTTREPRVS
jgi:hypothetical protein